MSNLLSATDLEQFKLYNVKEGERVVVAMSGGIDSSVAAVLMKNCGYEVIGVTLQLYDQGAVLQKKGACCAGQDIYDAKMVADQIGFAHYVFDYESIFKQAVIDNFADSYLKGQTPIPCIQCNQNVKFKDLLIFAKELGAKALITGHYVRQDFINDNAILYKAIDDKKDQSYFLFATTQEQLNYLRFPLGIISKEKTREYAKLFNLKISDKPDSQDICFVPNGSYANIVAKLRPKALDSGDIININTKEVLGKHNGIINFTIGQRKGIGISSDEPLYVVKIDADNKIVYVGNKENLAIKNIYLDKINLLINLSKNTEFVCKVKIRSTHQPIDASINLQGDEIIVKFKEEQFGIASGQACVFYKDNQVLGGGWINSKHLN